MKIQNKTILVTGGLRGIGRAISETFLEEGAKVLVLDLPAQKEGEKQLSHLDGATYFRCDVSDSKEVELVLNSIFSKRVHVDVLINNAGILYNAPLVGLSSSGLIKHSIDAWNRVISVDLNSVFYVSMNVVGDMVKNRTKGVILNISSIASNGNKGQSAYSAAKAGVKALMHAWSKELGPLGIRVLNVSPGFCETESTSSIMPVAVLDEIKREIPLKRLGTASEVADVVLMAVKNDYLSGTTIEIDGGLKI